MIIKQIRLLVNEQSSLVKKIVQSLRDNNREDAVILLEKAVEITSDIISLMVMEPYFGEAVDDQKDILKTLQESLEANLRAISLRKKEYTGDFKNFKRFSKELVEQGFTMPELGESNPFAILKVTFRKTVEDKVLCVTLNQEGFVKKDTDLIGVGYEDLKGNYTPVDTLEGISDITTEEIIAMF